MCVRLCGGEVVVMHECVCLCVETGLCVCGDYGVCVFSCACGEMGCVCLWSDGGVCMQGEPGVCFCKEC